MSEIRDFAWLTAKPIAHRGYHEAAAGRIENTLPAFEAAAARGFSIECDVWLTADDRVVVFHDETLDRLTTSSGPVSRFTLAELQGISFRGTDARIPALRDLLDLVDGRVPLVVELKGAPSTSTRLANAVAREVSGYSGPLAVMAFEPATMIAMRRAAPRLPRGMLVDSTRGDDYAGLPVATRFFRRHLLAAPSVMPRFVAAHVLWLPASAPLFLRHILRVPLLSWTVRNTADRTAAATWADQIIFEGFDPDR